MADGNVSYDRYLDRKTELELARVNPLIQHAIAIGGTIHRVVDVIAPTAIDTTSEAVEGWVEVLEGTSSFVADATDSVAEQFKAVLNGRSGTFLDRLITCNSTCGDKL